MDRRGTPKPGFQPRREVVEQLGKSLLVATVSDGLGEGSEALSFLSIHLRVKSLPSSPFPSRFISFMRYIGFQKGQTLA
jgi:hypothetical protein